MNSPNYTKLFEAYRLHTIDIAIQKFGEILKITEKEVWALIAGMSGLLD